MKIKFTPLKKSTNLFRQLGTISNGGLVPRTSAERPISLTGFTLIEVLVAATIFMLVAMMAAASFAAVRQTNARATDLKNTSECRETLQNFVQSEVKSSNNGARILGIKLDPTTARYVLSDFPALGTNAPFDGVALATGTNSYEILYKKSDDKTYYYKKITTGLPVVGPLDVQDSSSFLRSGNSTCYGSAEKSFQINKILDNGSGSSYSIVVNLEDKIYMLPPQPDNKNFAYVLLKSVNAGGNSL